MRPPPRSRRPNLASFPDDLRPAAERHLPNVSADTEDGGDEVDDGEVIQTMNRQDLKENSMRKLTSRIARTAALSLVSVLAATCIGASAAHATTLAPWRIDNDHVVVGASTVNSFKAFDGNGTSWYDGPNIRNTVTGPF